MINIHDKKAYFPLTISKNPKTFLITNSNYDVKLLENHKAYTLFYKLTSFCSVFGDFTVLKSTAVLVSPSQS